MYNDKTLVFWEYQVFLKANRSKEVRFGNVYLFSEMTSCAFPI